MRITKKPKLIKIKEEFAYKVYKKIFQCPTCKTHHQTYENYDNIKVILCSNCRQPLEIKKD